MRQQVYGGHTSALDATGRLCRTRGSKAVWSLHGCKVCAWHKDLLSPCTREGSVTDTFPGQEPSSSSSPFQVTHPISQKCNVPDTSHNKLLWAKGLDLERLQQTPSNLQNSCATAFSSPHGPTTPLVSQDRRTGLKVLFGTASSHLITIRAWIHLLLWHWAGGLCCLLCPHLVPQTLQSSAFSSTPPCSPTGSSMFSHHLLLLK